MDRSIDRSIDLSIYLNYIYPYPYPYVSIYLSRLSVDFSTDPFVYLPTYQSTNLPIYLFIFFSTYLVAYRSTYLSVCLTIHSSIHPGILLSTSYQPPPYLPIPACGGPHSARGKHAHAHYMRNRRYNVHCITGPRATRLGLVVRVGERRDGACASARAGRRAIVDARARAGVSAPSATATTCCAARGRGCQCCRRD